MSDFMKKIKMNAMVGYILCIIFGVIICIWPGRSLIFICRIAGIILLAYAVYRIIVELSGKEIHSQIFQVIMTVVLFVLALWLLIAPVSFVRLIPIVAGLLLIFHGIKNGYESVRFRQEKGNLWGVGLALSIVTAVLGIVLIRCAFLALQIGMVVLGVMLIYDGVSGLWITSKFTDGQK